MESEPTYHVPEELMQRLHAANESFHDSRQEWERMLGNTEDRHQERIDQAAEKLRAAERELEEANEAIRRALRQNAPPQAH
jgi:hypothetical protein